MAGTDNQKFRILSANASKVRVGPNVSHFQKTQHQVLPGLHFRTDSLGLSISASHRTINCFYSKHFVKGQKESLVTPTPPWSTNSSSQSDGKTDFHSIDEKMAVTPTFFPSTGQENNIAQLKKIRYFASHLSFHRF